jgi:hypothetical protein
MKHATLLLSLFLSCFVLSAQETKEEPYVIEYYYKIKWGYQQEFLDLYKKNHYPLLKDALESGDILEIRIESPENHASEYKRWDFRITAVWKSVAAKYAPFDEEALIKKLYPDLETWKKEEEKRFRLIEEHMDVPLKKIDISDW